MKRGLRYFILAVSLYILISAIYIISDNNEKTTLRAISGATIVSFEVLPICYIPLENGWNLISFCVNLSNKSIENAFSPINNSYRYVMEWNASNQEFMIYSPLAASNPFTVFDEEKSYFIYFKGENRTKLYAQGVTFENLNLSLLFGWETPTYPYEFEANITKYFSDEKFRYVMKWNVSNQEFMIYSPLAVLPEFEIISSGEGQFIYVKDVTGAHLFYNRTYLQ